MKQLVILLALLSSINCFGQGQDHREYNHGTSIVPYTDDNDSTKYYLTWSSSFNNSWEHDIYNATVYFGDNGNLTTQIPSQIYIQSNEAQEPVNATLNPSNNILSVWEDGVDSDGPNVRGQIQTTNGEIIRNNWIIAGGEGSQHSAYTSPLGNKYLVFYADEAPPSLGGAVLKCKVLDDVTGDETQTINLSPNDEDHWWPVSVSNNDNTRTLIVWGNDGFATRGAVLKQSGETIQPVSEPQDYLTDIQQYFYQVTWLENIYKFLLIARNGAYDNMTNQSQICLIDTSGTLTSSTILNGGILREAKMAVKWSDCTQRYDVIYPSNNNELTHFTINNEGDLSPLSVQISNHPDLNNIQWTSTSVSSTFVTDANQNYLFNDQYECLFVMNDSLSNNLIKIIVHLDQSIFCNPLYLPTIELSSATIFPNPLSDELHLTNIENILEVTIFNSLSEKITHIEKPKTEIIDMTALSNGIYFVKIKYRFVMKTFKVIKM